MGSCTKPSNKMISCTIKGRSGTLVKQGSACNRDLRIWVCLANFCCPAEGEAQLMDTTIGRIVSLLPVAPDHAESELEASVERLFDDGCSGNQTEQGNFTRGEQDANIQPVVEVVDTVVENVAPVQSRHQKKRKSMIVHVGGASHPPKKPRKDHGTSSGTSVGGKSRSALQRLLAGSMLNAEVRVAIIPTLSFVTASVSTTPVRVEIILTLWLILTSILLVLREGQAELVWHGHPLGQMKHHYVQLPPDSDHGRNQHILYLLNLKDISSRLPVDCKSIVLLTFLPPMIDSPESIFIIADRFLTPHCARVVQSN
nr:hypothetical protein [Tanacetum cinerariifolium]